LEFQSRSSEETKKIGFNLGKLLKAGNTVCLYGELGAGKTTFVKGVASALGISERDVASASFTIVVEYNTAVPLYHIDLYRLEENSDVEETGALEYIYGNGIALIEWAERLDSIPDDFIKIRFAIIDEDTRKITIEGMNEKNWHNL
jgi:tRNA threonylcarbamoyladenosine biosynthesis protein TsaE